MKLKAFARLLLVRILFSQIMLYAVADPIPATRQITWAGNVGVEGGLGSWTNRITIYTNLFPGATAAQITGALNTCPPNQVVWCHSGTYVLESAIQPNGGLSNVTLRGDGPTNTIFVVPGTGYGSIMIQGKNV